MPRFRPLPPLPEGWSYAQTTPSPDCVVIEARDPKCRCLIGTATVDFKRRVFRRGWSAYPSRYDSILKYTGRGWREQIIADAVAWLKGSG